MIKSGALVLILPKLEALTLGTITIIPGIFRTHKLNFTMKKGDFLDSFITL